MNTQQVLDSLAILGKGMLGIFIVTAIIVLLMVALNKISFRKKNKKNTQD